MGCDESQQQTSERGAAACTLLRASATSGWSTAPWATPYCESSSSHDCLECANSLHVYALVCACVCIYTCVLQALRCDDLMSDGQCTLTRDRGGTQTSRLAPPPGHLEGQFVVCVVGGAGVSLRSDVCVVLHAVGGTLTYPTLGFRIARIRNLAWCTCPLPTHPSRPSTQLRALHVGPCMSIPAEGGSHCGCSLGSLGSRVLTGSAIDGGF